MVNSINNRLSLRNTGDGYEIVRKLFTCIKNPDGHLFNVIEKLNGDFRTGAKWDERSPTRLEIDDCLHLVDISVIYSDDEEFIVVFDTPYDGAHPVFSCLESKFPKLSFIAEYYCPNLNFIDCYAYDSKKEASHFISGPYLKWIEDRYEDIYLEMDLNIEILAGEFKDPLTRGLYMFNAQIKSDQVISIEGLSQYEQ